MTLHTKGTRLYFATSIAPDIGSSESLVILRMRCPTAINGLDDASPDTARLDTAYPSQKVGADIPSDITIPFNFNQYSRAHQALVMMRDARVQCSFLLAFGMDSPAPNSVDGNGRLVSSGPLSAEWIGKVLVVSHQVEVGTIVHSTLKITRDSAVRWDFPAWSI